MIAPRSVLFAIPLALLAVAVAIDAKADAMAYAVDGAGAFGHGRAPAAEAARRIALDYCTQSACKIVLETSERCTVLVEGFGQGYRAFGAGAASRGAAEEQAMKACTASSPSANCRVRHWYCWN